MKRNRLLSRFLGDDADRIARKEAVDYVVKYFSSQLNGRPRYSGAHFEGMGNGWQRAPYSFTPEDVLAASLLSKPISGQAIVGILGSLAAELTECLRLLPIDRNFEDLSQAEYDSLLGASESPAQQAWNLLRQYDDSWDLGPTSASKLLARKRPHLIPIYDSFVAAEAGLNGSKDQWVIWRQAFQDDDFVEELRQIRTQSGRSSLSLLRTLDITLWMRHLENR